ncbi:MAG: long-chain fatty acid--CoA ligase [Leptospiraceae bacterium]|nr:long-chain fatty acid--CoA ligase [Leptospiraceae bacterium]
MSTGLQAKNIADLYKRAAESWGDEPAFLTRNKKKEFEAISYKDLYEAGLNLATGLIELGVEARENVALLADNREEWIICDAGILITGAADVPRGTDVTEGDIKHIVPHSGAKVVFVEHKAMLDKILKYKADLPNVQHIILMDKDTPAEGETLHMYDLIEKGKQLRGAGDTRAEERMAQIKPDDLFTLIYTSGTTGAPKGVMLMHSNMVSQVNYNPIPLSRGEKVISILPVWHVFERVFEMMAVNTGMATYYTNTRNLKEDLGLVKPSFMASAPRLWESIYLGIEKKVESGPGVARGLFKAAYYCSRMVKGSWRFLTGKQLDTEGRNSFISLFKGIGHLLRINFFLLPYLLLDTIVLSKIRAATGGRLKGSVSGGGALPLHVDQFFNNIGIPVLEGYGMTETCPVLAVRTFDELVIGSVGPIWPSTELRLVDISTGNVIYPGPNGKGKKGEIHVKGPQVMKGYYKNPEATEKVLKDGWMNTGDLGIITFNNTLKIVGRSKETVVLLGGENVEPVPIENKLLQSALVEHCMVVGQDKKFLSALIVPNPEAMAEYGDSHAAIAANADAQKMMQAEVKTLISAQTGFKSFERVVDCRLLPKPFEVGDELTNIFKLKRHVINEKYHDLIESMYE